MVSCPSLLIDSRLLKPDSISGSASLTFDSFFPFDIYSHQIDDINNMFDVVVLGAGGESTFH